MNDRTRGGLLSRRNFLKRSSLIPLSGLLAQSPAIGAAARSAGFEEQVQTALIGFGPQGRDIAATLARIPEATLAAVADHYNVMLRRSQRSMPEVPVFEDYRAVLDNPDISTVFVATPTHTHRQIALDALSAGKHVYVEAPMASTIEDARAMAQAARDNPNLIFQVGLLTRSHPNYRSVFQFIRSGALGRATMARAQWHSKESWRRVSPNAERETALNWRLDADVSTGLIGEVGMHQLDPAFWFLGKRPAAVTGLGQIMLWNDGRETPDTIQAIFEMEDGVPLLYDATLTSSFDGAYDTYSGRDSTIMFRDHRAWMFKEVDAPLLGWEVYARKDQFYKELGIALAANATQLDAQDISPTEDDPNLETPLWYAMRDFIDNHAFGPYLPAASYEVGFEAAVIAIRANEAILQRTRLAYDDALFAI